MTTCIGACNAVINALDDCALKTELQAFVADIFLELPEDPPSRYWHPAVALMERHANTHEWPVAMKAWNNYIEG